jgi:high affinity Mn2+ porin
MSFDNFWRCVSFAVMLWSGLSVACAEDAERFAIHGQLTYVEQNVGSFDAPYAGANSLIPHQGRETTDATLYIGFRLWPAAEAWLVPEIDEGFGLSNTLGVAGFPSGEAYKLGKNKPYLRLPRAFVRQTVNLGESTEAVEGGADQLGGSRSPDRLVFTLGKFGVTDIFDANQYAHDARADFLNWTAVDAGTFDYAADAWGFTVGVAAEWYSGVWTSRFGLFDLSDVPNSVHLEPGAHEFEMVIEEERRHQVLGEPGKLLITAYRNRGRMGLLDAAVALSEQTGGAPDLAAVRQYRSRDGVSISLEQQLVQDLGLFARAGKAGGNVEAYEFTDVDETVSLGLSLRGSRWLRPQDTLAIVGIENRISGTRERYFNSGGLGILVGDGRLPHPGPEQIVETYYSARIVRQAFVTFDYQHVTNPGYNRDRGPVSILGLRVHWQF